MDPRKLVRLGFLCLLPAPPPVRLVFGGLRAMAARWIPALAGGRAPFLDVSLSFVRVCVMCSGRPDDDDSLKTE